jgi:ribosomal RNA-processing protein 36
MEPASSSDDESSVEKLSSKRLELNRSGTYDDSSDDSSSDSSNGSDDEDEMHDFEHLPSEDSCLEDDSDEDDDSNNEEEYENTNHNVDVPLEERLEMKRTNGGNKHAKDKASKKSKALAIAQERLAAMKQKKRKQSQSESEESDSDPEEEGSNKKRKKKSKNAPTVASSTRRDFYKRGAPDLNSSGIGVEIGAHKYKARDPRLQSLSGHFDQNVFEKRYEFLEKVQEEEIQRLKERTKAWKTGGRKGRKLRKKMGLSGDATSAEADEAELARLMQERTARKEDKIRRMAKSTVKKKIRDDVAAGKRGAFYLKKRDMKKLELEAKFEQLRKQGGDSAVEKALAKRRKKKMGKDSSFMPNVAD